MFQIRQGEWIHSPCTFVFQSGGTGWDTHPPPSTSLHHVGGIIFFTQCIIQMLISSGSTFTTYTEITFNQLPEHPLTQSAWQRKPTIMLGYCFKSSQSVMRRRQRHPTLVLLPGKSQGRGSLVGCSPWGREVGHDWVTSLSCFTFMHWRRKRHPTPVFLPGESHGRRSLVGCSPWGREVGHDWVTSLSRFTSCTGEGNGNPLQCSCLENPRDGGAWWAAIYGVAQSRTRLKRLSSSSSTSCSTVQTSSVQGLTA